MPGLNVAFYAAMFLLISHIDGGLLAYLDPGTGSLVLQAVLAGIVGALALGRMYWRRVKAQIFRRDTTDDVLDR